MVLARNQFLLQLQMWNELKAKSLGKWCRLNNERISRSNVSLARHWNARDCAENELPDSSLESESVKSNLFTLLRYHDLFQIYTDVVERFKSKSSKTIQRSFFLQVFCLPMMDQFMKLTKLTIKMGRDYESVMCNTQLDKITLLVPTIWFNNCSKSVHKCSEILLLYIPPH